MSKLKIYEVHDNGFTSFRVQVCTNDVWIFRGRYDMDTETTRFTLVTIIRNPVRVFLGAGRSDEKCGVWHFDSPKGNTILVHLRDLDYLFIGRFLMVFTAESKIAKYVSNIGNNDVPYPYAVDADKRCYLLTEQVICEHYSRRKEPYTQYYAAQRPRGYKDLDMIVYAEYALKQNMLALRGAQECPRLARNEPIRKIPKELCRVLASFLEVTKVNYYDYH